MRGFVPFVAVGSLAMVAACATIPISGDPAVPVYAVAETAPVGTANEDAADDPAIWRNPIDPASSLIVATDKKGGLYVYSLTGAQISFLPAAGLNNVDLVTLPDGSVLVAASDRSDLSRARILLARLDTLSGQLSPIDRIEVGAGEGYGICMGRPKADGEVMIFSAPKNGIIYATQLRVLPNGSTVHSSREIARVPSQPEGCAFDVRSGVLYIGEEAAGIWSIDTATGNSRIVAPVDNRNLVADLEGLAIVPQGEDGGWLYASSQGDNSYMRYSLPDMKPAGRFRIAAGKFGATEETDGIEAVRGDFGPAFPGGIFIAQDGQNGSSAQNFKIVPLGHIEKALQD